MQTQLKLSTDWIGSDRIRLKIWLVCIASFDQSIAINKIFISDLGHESWSTTRVPRLLDSEMHMFSTSV